MLELFRAMKMLLWMLLLVCMIVTVWHFIAPSDYHYLDRLQLRDLSLFTFGLTLGYGFK